jgi:hypothetical protein
MADDLFARYGLECSGRGHKHGNNREWKEGQGVVGRGCKRFGDLVSNRDGTEDRVRRREVWRFGLNQGWNGGKGEEERGWETWSQPGIERRTGCYKYWVIRMSKGGD